MKSYETYVTKKYSKTCNAQFSYYFSHTRPVSLILPLKKYVGTTLHYKKSRSSDAFKNKVDDAN